MMKMSLPDGLQPVLGNRNTLCLLIGQVFSFAGDKVYRVALILTAYKLTGSPLDMGFVATATVLPAVLFSLPFGVVVDRHDRKSLMTLAVAVRGLTVLAVPLMQLSGHLTSAVLIGVAFAMGTMSQLFGPAYRAIVPSLVKKEELLALNSTFAIVEQSMGLLGPSLAGGLMLIMGTSALFYVTSASYAIAVATILAMHVKDGAVLETSQGLLAQVKEGFDYVRSTRPIFWLLVLAGIANLFLTGALGVIAPLYAKEVLRLEDSGYGFLVSMLTAGMLAGSMLVGSLGKTRRERLIALGFTGAGLSFVLVGLIPVRIAAFTFFFSYGLCETLVNVSFYTMVGELTAPAKLGVVSSLVILMSSVFDPVSTALSGFLATFVQPQAFFAMCGLVLFTAGLIIIRYRVLSLDISNEKTPITLTAIVTENTEGVCRNETLKPGIMQQETMSRNATLPMPPSQTFSGPCM